MTDLVFDVALCLLLVSASIGVVATADEPTTGDDSLDPDGIADALATSTATVHYDLEPGVQAADSSLLDTGGVDARELDRTAHGSLAGLLARATLGAVTIDGVRLTHARDGLRRAVGERVAAELPARGIHVGVQWTPYPGAPVRAVDGLGERPPESVAVHSATLRVPSGFPTAREDAIDASDDGFDAVARVVAERTIAGLFPPEQDRLALNGDEPVTTLMRTRYERAGRLLNASVEPEVARSETEAANADLSARLASKFEADMRDRFDSPRAAAESVAVGRITIVVRTWSR
ncbi:hypothetical protein ACFQJC_12655 [Haloferax namakaokahaiae]|uniref:SIMPL domain-containing protein n=1 Tax=Haloferax namakaokahaiae TaxID=1748331 RepID=A0ABD5ZHD2_9EURY